MECNPKGCRGGERDQNIVEAYHEQFQLVLQKVCLPFSVVSVFSCDEDQDRRNPSTIITIPAGNNADEQLSGDLSVAWDVTLFGEAVKKCKIDKVPVISVLIVPGFPVGGSGYHWRCVDSY